MRLLLRTRRLRYAAVRTKEQQWNHISGRISRRSVSDKKTEEALYILHTSIGAISVRRFVYRGEAGFVFLQGIDESGKDRILGFSEQQLSTFPFEIRMKLTDKNYYMMFNPHVAENSMRFSASKRELEALISTSQSGNRSRKKMIEVSKQKQLFVHR